MIKYTIIWSLLLSLTANAAIFNDVTVEDAIVLQGIANTRAIYLDGSGQVQSSATTPTELGYLSGVTSAIQTQITAKANISQTITNGVTTSAPSEDAVFDALFLKADLASPALTGNPTAPTQAASDNSTKIATTAYADNAASSAAALAIVQTITNGDTTHASSSDALFDALALKEPTITATSSADYYRGDKVFATLNTLAVPELTNLYYTQARFDTAFGLKSTTDLAEGTNLYFTDARARTAVIASSIVDGDLTHSPDGNSVFDALALKAPLADASTYRVGPGRQYTTIQSALTAIGNATTAAEVKQPKLVVIAGGNYDEALTIPQGRIITLQAEGTVVLGDGAGANWGSTTPRAITATFNNADVFGSDIKPALNLVSIPSSDPTSTFIAEAGTFIISGALNIAGDGLSHTVNLSNTKIQGTITKTAAGLTNLQGYKLYVVGAVSMATATILERCYDCEFDALVTVDSFNSLINSDIGAGMTVATNSNTLPPSGMFFTTFTGTFTGPASSFKVDLTSDYFFRTNGGTLAGGATRVLLASNATTAITGVLSSTDWTTFNNKEPAITATTSADYYRGDKTFQNFNTAAQAASISQVITNGVTTKAPSEDAVFDALALKEPAITATTSADYYRGDKTFQTLNTTAVPEGTNLYFTNARAQAAYPASVTITGNTTLAKPFRTYFADTFGGAFNATLPAASTHDGYSFHIKNTDFGGANNVTVLPTGGDLIEDSASDTITPGQGRTYNCNGVNWFIEE